MTRMIPRNEDMRAGDPMVFACADCGTPIWVPECYVAKPDRCPACGGEWCEAEVYLCPPNTNRAAC